jgi:hypothetical protein
MTSNHQSGHSICPSHDDDGMRKCGRTQIFPTQDPRRTTHAVHARNTKTCCAGTAGREVADDTDTNTKLFESLERATRKQSQCRSCPSARIRQRKTRKSSPRSLLGSSCEEKSGRKKAVQASRAGIAVSASHVIRKKPSKIINKNHL